MPTAHPPSKPYIEDNPGRYVGYAFIALAVVGAGGEVASWFARGPGTALAPLFCPWVLLALWTWVGWGLLHNQPGRRVIAVGLCSLMILGSLVRVFVSVLQAPPPANAPGVVPVAPGFSATGERAAVAVWVLLASAGLWALLRPRTRQVYRRLKLRDRGQELCSMCGYDLRGNTTGVCSECGTDIPPEGSSYPRVSSNPYVLEWRLQRMKEGPPDEPI